MSKYDSIPSLDIVRAKQLVEIEKIQAALDNMHCDVNEKSEKIVEKKSNNIIKKSISPL